ncbi:outer membrane protein assembly factor BamA [Candidatus Omnitrophota bacterium]
MKKALISIIFLFVLTHAMNAWAQDASTEKRVTALDVQGNRTISVETIIAQIKTRVGQVYSQNVISEDLKRLYNMGYFDDVSVDREDHKEGFRVMFIVIEKPIIDDVIFTGQRFINQRKLEHITTSKAGEFLDDQQLQEDLKQIEEEYQKKGFSDAIISFETDLDEDSNKAVVTFTIDEKGKLRITKIFFRGNNSFTSKRLMKLIKTRPDSLFTSGVFKQEVLDDDISRLRMFYQLEGFIDVTVDYSTEIVGKGNMHITISLEEGQKYTVGDVMIIGNDVLDESTIRVAIEETKPGSAFSQAKIQYDSAGIQSVYFDEGYIFAQVLETTSIDPDTGEVAVVFNISEGEVAYVDMIDVVGNIKTKDIVVRRELRINPGDRFDGYKLRRSKERLRNLGFFEEINYNIEDGSDATHKNLAVDVKEAKTGEFSFGGGYSTIDEFVGFLEVRQRNFDWHNWPTFTGDGQDLLLHAELGSVRENIQLSWTEPWFLDYPLSFGFDGYKKVHKRESDIGYGYDEERVGGDLRFGKELTEYVRADLMYKLEEIDIDNVSSDATNELKKEAGSNTISSLGFTLTLDKRDNVFDPTRGYLLSGYTEVAGGPLGQDKDYTKFIGKGSYDIPLPLSSVLEFRLRVGAANAFGDSVELPIYERFFAGGAYTIRGYNERKVGPIDPVSEDPIGGEAMLVGNIEYTIPVIDQIRLATFFDTGNVWKEVEDLGSGDFKSGMGVGLRVKTPIGPIRLDYGYPLDDEAGEEEKEGKFYFSFSHGF